MKKKTKLTIILFLFFSMILPTNVNALTDSFYEAEYIPNAYIKKFNQGSTTGKYEQMRIFRRTKDGKIAYCIELWETLKTGKELIGYQENYLEHTKLDSKTWEKIELLAYYGYEYQSHTSLNWYAATQYLIWKTINPESTIYFTNELNGEKTEKFSYEISEINRLIEEHYKTPSFIKEKVTLEKAESIKLIDLNFTLNNYDVSLNSQLTVLKNSMEQSIQIFPKDYGKTKVEFIKKDRFHESTTVYISDESQNLLVPGTYQPLKLYMDVHVVGGELTITKLDQFTNSKIPSSNELVLEATYQILNDEGEVITEVEINETKNPNQSISLPYGTYKVKEIKCGKGYQLDQNIYQITIDEQNPKPNLILKNKPYQTLLKIHKQYGNSDTAIYYDESGAIFEISNDSNFYQTVTTSNLGKAEILLPYGTYYIRQINGMKYYEYIDPKVLKVDETTEEITNWNLKNNEKGYYLKVSKIDKQTKNLIVNDSTEFKIKNIQTGEYVKDLSGNETWSTQNGFFQTDIKLQSGKYQLIEMKSPTGYIKQTEPLEVLIPLKNKTDTIEVDVENEKILGSIEIQKVGEISFIENENIQYKNQPLENVEFSIYSADLKKDESGNILYEMNQLIEVLKTNQDGLVLSKKLPLGKYYVIESKSLEGYCVDENKYYVEIKENNQTEKLVFQNFLLKQDIKILKIDSMTKKELSGATFGLYDQNQNKVKEVTTDSNGIAYFYQIPLGNYQIQELESPEEYYKSEISYPVTIEENEIFKLTIPNEKIEPVPKTSVDVSINNFTLWYFLLPFLSIGYIISRK